MEFIVYGFMQNFFATTIKKTGNKYSIHVIR